MWCPARVTHFDSLEELLAFMARVLASGACSTAARDRAAAAKQAVIVPWAT